MPSGDRPPSDIADAGLAEQGRQRVEYAEHAMPVLALLRERFSSYPHFDVIEGDVRDLSAMLADRGIAPEAVSATLEALARLGAIW